MTIDLSTVAVTVLALWVLLRECGRADRRTRAAAAAEREAVLRRLARPVATPALARQVAP